MEVEDNPSYERERRGDGSKEDLVVCGICHGVYLRRTHRRHKRLCEGEGAPSKSALPMELLESSSKVEANGDGFTYFNTDILGKLQNDEVGSICRTDAIIKQVGSVLWARLMREGGGSERSWESLRKKWGNVKTQANAYKLKRHGGTGKARWQCIFMLNEPFQF